MNEVKYGLLYSIPFHLLFVACIFHPGCSGGSGNGANNSANKMQVTQVELPEAAPTPQSAPKAEKEKKIGKIEKKSDKESQESQEVSEMGTKKVAKHADAPCNRFYGGLGLYEAQLADGRLIVREAVPGYPGADIGLEEGDVILSPSDDQVKGEVGTRVTLTVRKVDGTIHKYTVVRDKICLEDDQ